MSQNRNKIIKILIGNLSNHIVHKILESSINKEELTSKYRKEFLTSFEIAKRYRGKINPLQAPLSETDITLIKNKVISRAKSELKIRISKGYEGIDLNKIEKEVDNTLKELKIN